MVDVSQQSPLQQDWEREQERKQEWQLALPPIRGRGGTLLVHSLAGEGKKKLVVGQSNLQSVLQSVLHSLILKIFSFSRRGSSSMKVDLHSVKKFH